ncbi:hypothetical protein [Bradyrhizobium elkanii]|uniref:hypothetical protein n=1 Tax=Bradyrhizobium elkanii TaxID=29448 RepID=UPI003D1E220E
MLKRLGVALAALFAFLSVANAAGTVPGFSLTPQFDNTGKAASGCRLYVIQSGTVSTPQNPYFDSALTQVAPNPLICDATGRIGQFFVADGTIKLRLTDKNGVQIFAGDNLLVVGPSSGGGGGGGTVDPTTIASTGDVKVAYGTSVLSGWVRANGRTIGNATSGATERANADTSALFAWLWNADPNLSVSGGRGASAAADFSASKTIMLPDWRGRALAGLDDMGNSAAGRLTATYFGTSATVLGAGGGSQTTTISTPNLPPYTPSGSVSGTAHVLLGTQALSVTGGATQVLEPPGVGNFGYGVTFDSLNFNGSPQGGTSTPFAVASPMLLATVYLKL